MTNESLGDDIIWKTLNADYFETIERVKAKKNPRFAYYTQAETALKILANREVWMRNATMMNDYEEIHHGINIVAKHFGKGSAIEQFLSSRVNDSHPDIFEKIGQRFDNWINDLKFRTFITCVSEHSQDEDTLGRLSMWRAYGGNAGVALIFSAEPFQRDDDRLSAYSLPVRYMGDDKADKFFNDLLSKISDENIDWSVFKTEDLVHQIVTSLQFFSLSRKHPGFKEEQEWRIFHRPSTQPSKFLKKEVVTIGGVPQIIYKIPLDGNLDLAPAQIIERVIIGPCEHKWEIADTFRSILDDLGVAAADKKVFVSGIPLRSAR